MRAAGLPAPIENPGDVPIDYTMLELGNVTVRQVARVSHADSSCDLSLIVKN